MYELFFKLTNDLYIIPFLISWPILLILSNFIIHKIILKEYNIKKD